MKTASSSFQCHQGLVVLHANDADPSNGFWLLDMTAAEFETWWQEQATFERKTSDIDRFVMKIFGVKEDLSKPFIEDIPGEYQPAEQESLWRLWDQMRRSGNFYWCNFCCDSDSFLVTPDGRVLYHKGATNRREGEPRITKKP